MDLAIHDAGGVWCLSGIPSVGIEGPKQWNDETDENKMRRPQSIETKRRRHPNNH